MTSLKHVHRFPIAAKVLCQAVAELEADSQSPVFEEDVCVPQLRQVKAYPLALLRERSLHAPYEASALEHVDAPVAGGNRDPVLPAQLDRRTRSLEGRYEYLG